MADNIRQNQVVGLTPSQAGAEPETSRRRGYYKLADRMSLAENELAVFRNYKTLNILSLLQLQAEIHLLEVDLEYIRSQDDRDGSPLRAIVTPGREGSLEINKHSYARNELSSSMEAMIATWRPDPKKWSQYSKLCDIRAKLREYNELLLQFKDVCKLEQPDRVELSSLQYWISTRILDKDGNVKDRALMTPEEGLVYQPKNLDEYVLIQRPSSEKDIIPSFMLNLFASMYRFMKGGKETDYAEWMRGLFLRRVTTAGNKKGKSHGKRKDKSAQSSPADHDIESLDEGLDEGEIHFKKSRLILLGDWLAPILSSVFLVAASLILYKVPTTSNKLYVMFPLTVFFSVVVKACTSATRAETFAVIAAFVAVEVVFVGNVA